MFRTPHGKLLQIHWLVSEHVTVCACAAKKKVQGQQAQTPQQNIRYGGINTIHYLHAVSSA